MIYSKEIIVLGRPGEGALPYKEANVDVPLDDRAEQCLRMCIDGRGLGSNLVSFSKDFQNILTFSRFLRWFLNIQGSHLN